MQRDKIYYAKERYPKLKEKYNGLYGIWRAVKQRCYNANGQAYKYYGGRGIIVCKEWQDSFQSFYEWAKDKHKKGLQIDRRDNNGDYCPKNCRFVARAENIRNSRWVKLNIEKVKEIKILLSIRRLTQIEIGKMFNVSQSVISAIKKRNHWSQTNKEV